MRLFLVLIICLLFAGPVSPQETGTSREQKQEASRKKKAERAKKMEQQFAATGRLLEGKRFVLEAQYLSGKMGDRKPVVPVLNFISVDSVNAVIQVGSPQLVGYNGVGGITGEGKVTQWKLTKNEKRKNFTAFLTINSNIGIFNVQMSIDYSGYASASMTGLTSFMLTFDGMLVSREESVIFKGQSY